MILNQSDTYAATRRLIINDYLCTSAFLETSQLENTVNFKTLLCLFEPYRVKVQLLVDLMTTLSWPKEQKVIYEHNGSIGTITLLMREITSYDYNMWHFL